MRVLYLDDEIALLQLFQDFFTSIGCEMEIAENSKVALDKFSRARQIGRPFDVVLLDWRLSEPSTGDDVLAEMSKVDHAVKGVLFTGYSEKALHPGFLAIITKPCLPLDVYRVLKNIVENEQNQVA